MMQEVLPPANGKKLWRVKRINSVSTDATSTTTNNNTPVVDSSVECLNNSLRISAAGNRLTTKRPPLRRPKNKPGKPKDFVFVDLSPIKTDESEDDASTGSPNIDNIQLPSPNQSIIDETSSQNSSMFDMPQLNDSFSALSTSSEDIFSSFDNSSILGSGIDGYMQVTPHCQTQSQNSSHGNSMPQDQSLLGLGINNTGVTNWEQPQMFKPQPQQVPVPVAPNMMFTQQIFTYQQAMLQQYQQIQLLQQQLQQVHQMQQVQDVQQVQQQVPQMQIPMPQQPIQQSHTVSAIETGAIGHKRSKSTVETSMKKRNSGQFQFKTYTGPKHRHSASESSIKKQRKSSKSSPNSPNQKIEDQINSLMKPVGLEDFMMLSEQLDIPLEQGSANSSVNTTNDSSYETFTPISDYSDDDLFYSKPKAIDANLLSNCGIDQFLFNKSEDFELSGFVSM
ncbi:hypothetical protein DFJ63DRAFT_334513 [Scheffersomyces coipomensis]|uniref:uncharacterized protein n=1 Tax=Scheffersomyces coipomensis TaxID=1788519 RepID=UPI00315D238A